jgi:hypothetical protein
MYTPRQLAQLGIIRNSIGSENEISNYQFILHEIEADRLEAINISAGEHKAHYIVTNRAIKQYLNRKNTRS